MVVLTRILSILNRKAKKVNSWEISIKYSIAYANLVRRGGIFFFLLIFLNFFNSSFLRYNTYFIHEYKWDVVLQINGKVKIFWPHTSQTYFFPTPIRDLKANILEVHNGFIHHEKKLPVFLVFC